MTFFNATKINGIHTIAVAKDTVDPNNIHAMLKAVLASVFDGVVDTGGAGSVEISWGVGVEVTM
jgi:hypothetical protein